MLAIIKTMVSDTVSKEIIPFECKVCERNTAINYINEMAAIDAKAELDTHAQNQATRTGQQPAGGQQIPMLETISKINIPKSNTVNVSEPYYVTAEAETGSQGKFNIVLGCKCLSIIVDPREMVAIMNMSKRAMTSYIYKALKRIPGMQRVLDRLFRYLFYRNNQWQKVWGTDKPWLDKLYDGGHADDNLVKENLMLYSIYDIEDSIDFITSKITRLQNMGMAHLIVDDPVNKRMIYWSHFNDDVCHIITYNMLYNEFMQTRIDNPDDAKQANNDFLNTMKFKVGKLPAVVKESLKKSKTK